MRSRAVHHRHDGMDGECDEKNTRDQEQREAQADIVDGALHTRMQNARGNVPPRQTDVDWVISLPDELQAETDGVKDRRLLHQVHVVG